VIHITRGDAVQPIEAKSVVHGESGSIMLILARGATLAALVAVTSACTIVRVGDGRGAHITYYPGVAVIHVTPADSVQLVEVESVGAVAVGNQASLGWSHSWTALVPPGRCQFIAWRAATEQIETLHRLLGAGTEICSQEGGTQ
jgi:hypothetical protein